MKAEKLQKVDSLLYYLYGDTGKSLSTFLYDPSKLRTATLSEAKSVLKVALALPDDDTTLSAESSARIIELIPSATLGELELVYEMLFDLLGSPSADEMVINGILDLIETKMTELISSGSLEEVELFCELAISLIDNSASEAQGVLSFYKALDAALFRLNELLCDASFDEFLAVYDFAADMIYDAALIGLTPVLVEIIGNVTARISELLPTASIDDVGFVFVAIGYDYSELHSSEDAVISESTAFVTNYGITLDLFGCDIKAAALATIKNRLATASLDEAESFCEFLTDLCLDELSDDDIMELVVLLDSALARILELLSGASFDQIIDAYETVADMVDIQLFETLSSIDDIIDISFSAFIERLPNASFKETMAVREIASDLIDSEYAGKSVLVDGMLSTSYERLMELLPQSSYDEAESLHDLAIRSSDVVLEVAVLKRIFDLA